MNLFLEESTEFQRRHIGLNEADTQEMLNIIGVASVQELMKQTIPETIRLKEELDLPQPISENDYLKEIKITAGLNKVFRSYIGQGYYNTLTPSVILRNVYENRAGTLPTRLIRQKYRKDVWRACLIFRQ